MYKRFYTINFFRQLLKITNLIYLSLASNFCTITGLTNNYPNRINANLIIPTIENSNLNLNHLADSNDRAAASVVNPSFYDNSIRPCDLSPTNVTAMHTISNSGRYYLSNNIAANSSVVTGVPIIKITASNIVLDLNQATITKYGANTYVNVGIEIASNLSNITIQNGKIADISGIGIKINTGVTNLVLQDLIISGCYSGVQTVDTANCYSILIQNLQCINATGGVGYGIYLHSCHNVLIKNTNCNYNTGTTPRGFILTTCKSAVLENCQANCNINSNSGGTVYGILLTGTSSTLFSSACVVRNCTANYNQATFATGANQAYGFALATYATGCFFSNCLATGQACASTNSAAYCAGFYFDATVKRSIIENSYSYDQNTAYGAYGIYLGDGNSAGPTNCIIRNCQLYDNTGSTLSFGLKDFATQSTTLLAHNVVSGNGKINPNTSNMAPTNPNNANYYILYNQDIDQHSSQNLFLEGTFTAIGAINPITMPGMLGEFQNLSVIS